MVSCMACFLLGLHFLTFGAQLLALALFWQTGNFKCFGVCLATLLFTGCFFSDAVWRGAFWRPFGVQVLPIKRLPGLPRALCCCPLVLVFGCLQGVMVPLTLEQVQTGDGGGTGAAQEGHGAAFTSFHGKAVNGLFEGIVCSAVLLYSYVGAGFPDGSLNPVTREPPDYPLKFLGLKHILGAVGLISFGSGGLGILHLDHCLCMKLGAYIRSGYCPMWRLFRHWLFRTCELVSRVSMHVFFLLVTSEMVPHWRWAPLLVSLLGSVTMMYCYGGNEASRSVIWLCGFLCTFVDVFRFLDSPYKRWAARRLSKVLAMRNAAELVYMPCLAVLLLCISSPQQGLSGGFAQLGHYLGLMIHYHAMMLICTSLTFPLYFFLLFSISVQRFLEKEKDIFTACDQLDVKEVQRLAMGGVRVDVNCQDNEGRTPLVRALIYGLKNDECCAEICGILLESGAKIDMKAPVERLWIRRIFRRVARLRWTPLHIAAYRGSAEVLRRLLQWVPLNAPAEELLETFTDVAGDTPLHVAAWQGRAEAVKCLVGRFPSWADVPNRKGATPWDLARAPGLSEALHSPALAVGAAEAHGERALASAQWSVEEHHVARVMGGRGVYRAPGLCSYVVGTAGGPACGSVLKLAPEDQLLQLQQLHEEQQQALGRASSLQRRSTQLVASAPHVMTEELEPLAKQGRVPCPDWLEKLKRQPTVDVGFLVSSIRQRGFCREAVLGKGAFGVVWLARRRAGQGELYAVKNIAGTGSVARRECDMSDQVRVLPHPCLVKLYGVQEFVDVELCVLIMEFIPGGDLLEAIGRAWVSPREYTPPPETLPWLGQIFLALEHLHMGMHVLLRDLKPDNVVLDERRRAKLIDLGLGRIGTQSDGAFTLTSAPPGTPGYCAPEVLQQQAYNEKADIYSFGVTAWMLLTGGLMNRSPPRPPTGFNGRAIQSCFWDCELLHKCIDDPSGVAQPLGQADAYAFVTSLTATHASMRPDHEAIRAHAFFTEHLLLPLPERRAGPSGVERWLTDLGF